jgi:hypothetical protein
MLVVCVHGLPIWQIFFFRPRLSVAIMHLLSSLLISTTVLKT